MIFISKLLEKLNESQAGFYEIKQEKASETIVFLLWVRSNLGEEYVSKRASMLVPKRV